MSYIQNNPQHLLLLRSLQAALTLLLCGLQFSCSGRPSSCSNPGSTSSLNFSQEGGTSDAGALYGGFITYAPPGEDSTTDYHSCQSLIRSLGTEEEGGGHKVLVYTSLRCLLGNPPRRSAAAEDLWLSVHLEGDANAQQGAGQRPGYLSVKMKSQLFEDWRKELSTANGHIKAKELRKYWAVASAKLSETEAASPSGWQQDYSSHACTYGAHQASAEYKKIIDTLTKRQEMSLHCIAGSDLTAFEGELLASPEEIKTLNRAKVVSSRGAEETHAAAFSAWDKHIRSKMSLHDLPMLREALQNSLKTLDSQNLTPLTSLPSFKAYALEAHSLWQALPLTQVQGEPSAHKGLMIFSNNYAKGNSGAVGWALAPLVANKISRLILQTPGVVLTMVTGQNFAVSIQQTNTPQDIEQGHYVAYSGALTLIHHHPIATLFQTNNAPSAPYDPAPYFGVAHVEISEAQATNEEEEQATAQPPSNTPVTPTPDPTPTPTPTPSPTPTTPDPTTPTQRAQQPRRSPRSTPPFQRANTPESTQRSRRGNELLRDIINTYNAHKYASPSTPTTQEEQQPVIGDSTTINTTYTPTRTNNGWTTGGSGSSADARGTNAASCP